MVTAVARVAKVPADVARPARGGKLRRLIAWISWHEGLVTLRTIAAALRLRSEGYVSNLIRRCDREFREDEQLLASMDLAIAALRA